eukprot:COSAG06_NODE_42607_length_380_cov_0.733096_1_plen_126_part_11
MHCAEEKSCALFLPDPADGSMGGSGSGSDSVDPSVPAWELAYLVERVQKQENVWASVATIVYLLAYLIFLFVHRRTAPTAFNGKAWGMVIILNVLTTCLFVYALVLTENALKDVEHNAWDEIKRIL